MCVRCGGHRFHFATLGKWETLTEVGAGSGGTSKWEYDRLLRPRRLKPAGGVGGIKT